MGTWVTGSETRYKLLLHGSRFARLVQRLGRSQTGASAVEFALVVTPFMVCLFSFFEIGLVLLSQEELQTAATQASRLIMTGVAKNQNLTSSQLTQQVCAILDRTFNCSSIYINVQTFSSFSSVSAVHPLNKGVVNTETLNYSIGNPGDIVLMQVFYQLPIVTAFLGSSLTNMNGNYRLIQATAVFRNEPY